MDETPTRVRRTTKRWIKYTMSEDKPTDENTAQLIAAFPDITPIGGKQKFTAEQARPGDVRVSPLRVVPQPTAIENHVKAIAEQLRTIVQDTGHTAEHLLSRVKQAVNPEGQTVPTRRRFLSTYANPDTRPAIEEQVQANQIFERYALFKGDRPGILVAQSGIGKSTLLMQEATLWAVGTGLLFKPVRPLRVLILETEEHDSDYLDIMPGVMTYAEQQGLEIDLGTLDDMVIIQSVAGLYGDDMSRTLERLIDDSFDSDKPIDLVVLNPAFAFIGGDASSQEVVTDFLRNRLDPLVKRPGREIGLLIVHHTKKVNADSARYKDNDAMYATFGSAEWTNASRLIVTIEAIANSQGYYQAIGAKRGNTLGWKDAGGEPTNRLVIAHAPSTNPDGSPNYDRYWRIPDQEELEALEQQTARKTKAEEKAENISRLARECLGWFDSTTVMTCEQFNKRAVEELNIKTNTAKTIQAIVREMKILGIAQEKYGPDRKNHLGLPRAIRQDREQ